MTTVLVALDGGEGMIRLDNGDVRLTNDVTDDWGQPLQPWDRYQPIRLGLGDDRMLFGGLLPPGAVSVEAVEATGVRKQAAVGGGVYVVVLEDGEPGEPVLGYRDAAGAFVHRPMPGDYEHRPVLDAEEPCPMCGAIEYEEYFPTEEWRGGSGWPGTDPHSPNPLIVCRVCGHEETGGGISRMMPIDPGDEDAAEQEARMARYRAEWAVQRWYANKLALMAVTFPVYAAEGLPAQMNGSGSHNDELTSVVIGQARTLSEYEPLKPPRIAIETSIEPHQPGELAIAREMFSSRMDSDETHRPADGLSDAALVLWFRADRRRRVSAAYSVAEIEAEISIDGELQPFVLVGDPAARWVAVRRHDDLTISIDSRGIEPGTLALEPLADPAGRLLGPEPSEL